MLQLSKNGTLDVNEQISASTIHYKQTDTWIYTTWNTDVQYAIRLLFCKFEANLRLI